jgi:DNA-binding HxlR family transcriptional regulator
MSHEPQFCPVYASIELLQEKWNLHIIRSLLAGPMGFNDLGRAVGANPTTLAQRLERLESIGVLERSVHSVMPPRTSYALTCSGRALQSVIDAIDQWGREHLNPELTARSAAARPRAAGRAPAG